MIEVPLTPLVSTGPVRVRSRGISIKSIMDDETDEKNDRRKQYGEMNPKAKLSDEVVREIRACTHKSQRELAAEHGISQTMVSRVQSRRYWAHVAD